MIQFYSNVLDGKSYAESIRLAKLKLIEDAKTAFPHFWGGFVRWEGDIEIKHRVPGIFIESWKLC